MDTLNSITASVEPWGELLVTGLRLNFVPLVTTLWAQLFSQYSIHLTVCTRFFFFYDCGILC